MQIGACVGAAGTLASAAITPLTCTIARLQQQKRCCLTIICPVTCAKPGHNRPVLSPVFRNLSFQPSQGCCFSECASPSSTKERVLQICKSTQACLREALPESFANKKPFFVSSTSLSQRTPAAHSCFAPPHPYCEQDTASQMQLQVLRVASSHSTKERGLQTCNRKSMPPRSVTRVLHEQKGSLLHYSVNPSQRAPAAHS